VLADANPAIATLSTVTWRSLDEARLDTEIAPPGAPAAPAAPASPMGEPAPPMGEPTAPRGEPDGARGAPAAPRGTPAAQPAGWRSGRGQPPPNLGPPPEPPDWRTRRH
jgi:hypothetical protein